MINLVAAIACYLVVVALLVWLDNRMTAKRLAAESSPAARRTDGHCVQYAIVGGHEIVLDTAQLTDEQIQIICGYTGIIERFNRCPECEVWTTTVANGSLRLRTVIDCPAVQERMAANR